MGSGFAEALQGMSAGVNVVNVQGVTPELMPVWRSVVLLPCPERPIRYILWTGCLTMEN